MGVPSILDSRAVLNQAIAERRDLPYSFWHEVASDRAAFTRPLPAGPGPLDVEASWDQGTEDIHVTVTLIPKFPA